MAESLHLLVCGAYFGETESVVRRGGWTDVVVHTYPTVCMLPRLQEQLEATIQDLRANYRHFAIIGTCPVVYRLKTCRRSPPPPPKARRSVSTPWQTRRSSTAWSSAVDT